MSTKIDDLSAKCREKFMAFKAELDKEGIPFVIVFTRRTDKEQIALFAQGRESLEAVNALRKEAGLLPIGRSENSYTVTKCDGVKLRSNHQDGNAFDLTFADYRGRAIWPDRDTFDGSTRWLSLGAIAESVGLSWGGRFKPLNKYGVGWDPCHFEV